MLKLIRKDYEFPTNIMNEIHVLKDIEDFSEEKEKGYIQNYKSIIFLVHVMDVNESNKIKHYRTAKEIWRFLEVTYEGTDQVKQSKLNLFEQAYELFKIKPNKNVDELYVRYIEIVNGLMLNGKILCNTR